MKQYNGFYGCNICELRGKQVNGVHKYSHGAKIITRTTESYLNPLQAALDRNREKRKIRITKFFDDEKESTGGFFWEWFLFNRNWRSQIIQESKSRQQSFLPRRFEILSQFVCVQSMLRCRQICSFSRWWYYNYWTHWFLLQFLGWVPLSRNFQNSETFSISRSSNWWSRAVAFRIYRWVNCKKINISHGFDFSQTVPCAS